MKYLFNGKEIEIADKELTNLMQTLDITQEEAIETWLCDNDYVNNEQEEELTAKAKANGTTKVKATGKTRAKRVVEKKENPVKSMIIAEIVAKLLENEQIVDIKIVNDTKMIDFSVENRHFSINLVEHRAKKTQK